MRVSEITSSSREEINVVYAEEECVRPGRCCGPVIRSVYIIECCTGGKGSVIINGKEFPFQAGDCYALLPGDAVRHTTDKDVCREGVWCALDGLPVGTYLKKAGITSDSPYFDPSLFEDVRQWISTLVQYWPQRDAGAQLRQNACALGLLGAVLKNNIATENQSLIDKAIGFMQTNYNDPLNVTKVANQVGLERTYFSSLFKEKTGLSPHQYLTQLRIQKACQLLDTREHSVSEVSYLVGFEPHNFSRLFKKETGITPLEYYRKTKQDASLLKARTKEME